MKKSTYIKGMESLEAIDDINFFIKPGTKVRFVGFDEPLRKNFLLRERYEFPMLSQDGGWDTTFKENHWRGTAWHFLLAELPAWEGRSYKEYLEFCDYEPRHEIVEILYP